MCGICGIYGLTDQENILRKMVAAIAHRGPDDQGLWTDSRRVGLGHTRLSILDLSPLGHQPMHSACGRYTIVYNGEVYNHLTLREGLDYPFRSTSDTETILAAVSAWGIEAALHRFIGMFAFALWDAESAKLFLIRDRLGVKPLYYGRCAGGWVFGSELKALQGVAGCAENIDRDSLALYFRHNYIPAPYSIYEGVEKVLPGEMVTIDEAGPIRHIWWDVHEVWRSGFSSQWSMCDKDAVDALEGLLSDAVDLRMLADVPLGAFLSGGIDSSTVVALMQARSRGPVKTFSIGFREATHNEAYYARAVAEHLGTDHKELYVSPRDLLDVIPSIPRLWDEPFADSSQIPTYILSRLTREHVTVSLSGDGGDELFAGYHRYFHATRWDKLSAVPLPVRNFIKLVLKITPALFFKALGRIGPKIRWRLDLLSIEDFQEFYRYLVSHFKHPEDFVHGSRELSTPLTQKGFEFPDKFAQMALWDLQMYLPDDILTKVDRASMAVGLEARVPLLDHRVVEFAARTPLSFKVRGGKGKWLLKQVLYRHVPKELIERPKMGFGVPIERWMRNELREWCGDLLNADTLKRQGYLDADKVARMWNEYLSGESNWHYYLWDVLMFQAWLEAWGKD